MVSTPRVTIAANQEARPSILGGGSDMDSSFRKRAPNFPPAHRHGQYEPGPWAGNRCHVYPGASAGSDGRPHFDNRWRLTYGIIRLCKRLFHFFEARSARPEG